MNKIYLNDVPLDALTECIMDNMDHYVYLCRFGSVALNQKQDASSDDEALASMAGIALKNVINNAIEGVKALTGFLCRVYISTIPEYNGVGIKVDPIEKSITFLDESQMEDAKVVDLLKFMTGGSIDM